MLAWVLDGIIIRCTVFVTGVLTAEATATEGERLENRLVSLPADLQKMAMENYFSILWT